MRTSHYTPGTHTRARTYTQLSNVGTHTRSLSTSSPYVRSERICCGLKTVLGVNLSSYSVGHAGKFPPCLLRHVIHIHGNIFPLIRTQCLSKFHKCG